MVMFEAHGAIQGLEACIAAPCHVWHFTCTVKKKASKWVVKAHPCHVQGDSYSRGSSQRPHCAKLSVFIGDSTGSIALALVLNVYLLFPDIYL